MSAKCPKCERLITAVNLEGMTVRAGRKQWVGIAYKCPYCSTAISVAIDPVALKTDTIAGVVEKLRER